MLPVLLPIANGLGLDLVHFGVMVVLNLMIGQVTPPFGVCLFVISDVNKLKLERLYRSILPFLVPFDFNADSGNLYTGDRYSPAKRPAELRTSPVPNHPLERVHHIMSDQLFSVENKICIVTGGLGQIGKNFVQELWKRAPGWPVGPHRQRRAHRQDPGGGGPEDLRSAFLLCGHH